MTIQHYTDHAANERTFLAWVRTSVAIIGLGFLVERFDLFIASTAPASSAAKAAIAVPREQFGHIAGLVLIVAEFHAEAIARYLQSEAGVSAWVIGEVVKGDKTVAWV